MAAKTTFVVSQGAAPPPPPPPVSVLHAGEPFMLLNAADITQAVTFTDPGFGPVVGPSGSAAQQFQLNKFIGEGHQWPNADALGKDVSQWAVDGASTPLEHGDIVVWYNAEYSKVYDCAGPGCSMQPFPPPAGHWGTPFRVYKTNLADSQIHRGDDIYFDRMLSGVWNAAMSITCTDLSCGGGEMAAKTTFVVSQGALR